MRDLKIIKRKQKNSYINRLKLTIQNESRLSKVTFSIAILFSLFCSLQTQAQVSLPNVFTNHMVLQRNTQNPVWGKASKGEKITVSIAGQTKSITTDTTGKWKVMLEPITAGGPYIMTVTGTNTITISDILIGEVWMCSGQSNMGFPLNKVNNAEIEIAAANYPNIRFLSVPRIGSAEYQDNIDAFWNICTPETIANFSAVGYLFGKNIHQALGVPIGLINTAWGGAPVEAFIPRKSMDTCKACKEMLNKWDKKMDKYTDKTFEADKKEYEAWVKAGKPDPKKWPAVDERIGKGVPANIYNAMVHPIAGYGMKGAIWYQGEANTRNPEQYRSLFPLLIQSWRDQWQQGDFSFYWAQLADFKEEDSIPTNSSWAMLREAQTMTLSLPNTGQAVIIDAGEGRDIHPRDKQTVAYRLVRHAFANDYGFDLKAESPEFDTLEKNENSLILKFKNIDKGLYTFDSETVLGFAISGEDQKFYWAEAKIIGKDKIEISSKNVKAPVAARYGWSDNPKVNLYDGNGLPVTPFRTDNWSK